MALHNICCAVGSRTAQQNFAGTIRRYDQAAVYIRGAKRIVIKLNVINVNLPGRNRLPADTRYREINHSPGRVFCK